MKSTIYKKIDQYIVLISPFRLNDVQRRFSVLKEKEDQGYWTGSISNEIFTLVDLSSKPTRLEVMEEALEKLKEYGCNITIEDLESDDKDNAKNILDMERQNVFYFKPIICDRPSRK